MSVGIIWFGWATYALMLAAYRWARIRAFHISVMASTAVFDVVMPFYLYATRDWYQRLIVKEEILSFLLWMHFGLVLVLYGLYLMQVRTAREILRGDAGSRIDHHGQGKAVLLVRALVLITAALLIDPEA
jgi:hypothetical protein